MFRSSFSRLLPVLTGSTSNCRWLSRRRLMPPEFLKQYVAKIDQSQLDTYRDRNKLDAKKRAKEYETYMNVTNLPEFSRVYQELVPHNLDPRYRDRLRERLERREMMLRRCCLNIPEFYVGSVLSVSVADKFAPNGAHRFVGICIERLNEGLNTSFTLRNVIDKTAVEIQYELYNPTLQSIEVLLLEKRLDQNLLYLRDAPLQESRFSFDMTSIPHPPNTPVPINPKKVVLLPPPWKFKWYLHGYQGIDESMFDYLTPEQLDFANTKLNLVDRYDLLKVYQQKPCLEDREVAFGDVHIQHQDLIHHHEKRRQELIEKYQSAKATQKLRHSG